MESGPVGQLVILFAWVCWRHKTQNHGVLQTSFYCGQKSLYINILLYLVVVCVCVCLYLKLFRVKQKNSLPLPAQLTRWPCPTINKVAFVHQLKQPQRSHRRHTSRLLAHASVAGQPQSSLSALSPSDTTYSHLRQRPSSRAVAHTTPSQRPDPGISNRATARQTMPALDQTLRTSSSSHRSTGSFP